MGTQILPSISAAVYLLCLYNACSYPNIKESTNDFSDMQKELLRPAFGSIVLLEES